MMSSLSTRRRSWQFAAISKSSYLIPSWTLSHSRTLCSSSDLGFLSSPVINAHTLTPTSTLTFSTFTACEGNSRGGRCRGRCGNASKFLWTDSASHPQCLQATGITAGIGNIVSAILRLHSESVLGTDCYLQNYRLRPPHQHCSAR